MSERPALFETESGLLNGSQNWTEDGFRWKVAAAVVEEAQARLEDPEWAAVAARMIWEWSAVGEVFARLLHIALKVPVDAPDDRIREAVATSWEHIAAGMPAKE